MAWRFLVVCSLLFSSFVYADPPKRDPAAEARYAEPLMRADPALAKEFQTATQDMDAERWSQARTGFAHILSAAPDHVVSMRRLAFVLHQQKRSADAIMWARKAAKDTSDPLNQISLANILAEQSDPQLREEAVDLARSGYRRQATEETALVFAQTVLKARQTSAMPEASEALEATPSKNPAAKLFLAVFYSAQEQWSNADRAIDEAVDLGFPAANAAKLRTDLGIEEHMVYWRYAKIAGIVLSAWLAGLLLIYVLGRVLSGRILSAIDRHVENPDGLVGGTKWLRKAYAAAIAAAALCYFISIPVLLAIVIGGAAAILWGIWMIGYIPIKLVVLIGIGVVVTVWAVLRSLFVRRGPEEDPGRRILPEQAPKLWEVLREVAGKVGTRPVDKVFLTMGSEMAVRERGSLSKRLRDQGDRILLLGASLLSSMTTWELKAILAHEYGHFSNRDTAGGDVAMTVNASLFSTALTLARSGVSALNPAWQFLKIYSGLFARITQGASRLQEILADRFAALQYGPTAFASGLTAAVRRQVMFDAEVNERVRLVGVDKQPILNLYSPPALPSDRLVGLDTQVREAMDAKASEFDSHPPPNKRIALVSRYPEPASASEPDDEAWSLIPNRQSFEADFTWKVNEQLRDQGVLPPSTAQPQTISI